MNMSKIFYLTLYILLVSACKMQVEQETEWTEGIQSVLDNTSPLKYSRNQRLPLYLWPASDPGKLTEKDAENLVKELDRRGVGLISSWDIKREQLDPALTIAKAQKKSGQRVNINATSLLYSFFDGDERTAHVDKDGKPFFDDSFGSTKMGCPFAVDFRKKEIRERIEFYVNKYKVEDLPIDFIFADWEIDGPIEVNRAFENSKRCARCCEHMGTGFTFPDFQKKMREMRSYLQYYSYSAPVLSEFPQALVGNYAVYPNDGYRYWYDYFEYYVDGQPYKADQKAKYRNWYNDYPSTGYTFAMPVVYTWDGIYGWYDFDNTDYRWFYNMLLVASNAGRSTPQNIPIISFVHWNTVFVINKPDSGIKQMSKESYQELLWHMLLRGTDTFFMWCMTTENPEEVRLTHEVYAAAQQYGDFLEKGLPINYDVPDSPGVVISGLTKGDSVLIRRTDFGSYHGPVNVLAGTKMISVAYTPGECIIASLN
jgi:hypothetical protein